MLHKNPANEQTRELTFGKAHVFYPQVKEEACTAALLLDIDVIELVRGRKGERTLEHYVNDRPYVASSFLSVAMAKTFREVMNGQSRERPELAQTPIPLVLELPVVPARGGEEFVHRLFEPLGYTVQTKVLPLDEKFPEWGQSRYVSLRLEATVRVADALSHLYVFTRDKSSFGWCAAVTLGFCLKRRHLPNRVKVRSPTQRRDSNLVPLTWIFRCCRCQA